MSNRTDGPEAPEIKRLIGVYNANGTIRGELAYWIGARLGRGHCSLCEITHGAIRERDDWRDCRASLAAPFDTFHRNDQPANVRSAADGLEPVVAAETSAGIVVLLGPDDLDSCDGSPDRLIAAIVESEATFGLRWP